MQVLSGQRQEIEEKAARIIYEKILELLRNKEKVVLGIPGGSSVAGIFSHLKWQTIPWEKVHIFMVDERLVPLDDINSNFKLAQENFIQDLINRNVLPSANVHPFIFDEENQDFGIGDYDIDLKSHGGKYDIILLSSGEDSHIASLFPNHSSIKDDSDFFINMRDSPKPPVGRMSASLSLLSKAHVGVLLFFGETKKQAYEDFLDKSKTIESCPTKLLYAIPEAFVFTDVKELDKNHAL